MSVKNLLVVDDQPGVRFLICEIFREEGYSVAEAGNFEEAIETAKKFMPEVALVDMRLGNNRGYDGGDIIKELKKCIPDLVSIIITADGEPDKLNKAMMNGAVYCLEKPFTVGEIVGVVNEQYARYVCGEEK